MTYEDEKKYLNKCAIDALKNVDDWFMSVSENNVIKLTYYGEDIDTEVRSIQLLSDTIVEVISYSDEYPFEYKLSDDVFTDFSNDEMKRILDLFNIKY